MARTDAEVTAAAERTADLALNCARLTRERDEALAAVERVRALAESADAYASDEIRPYESRRIWAIVVEQIRAALGERP